MNQAGASECRVWVGTYNSDRREGVFGFRLDAESGRLTPAAAPAEARNPSFLAAHPSGRFLYAVSETDGGAGRPCGAVSAFAVAPDSGALSLLNRQSSGGAGPCHLAVHPSGQHVLVANYRSGSVAMLPIEPDGRLQPPSDVAQHEGRGVVPDRQEGPHAHSVTPDPAGRFALACDLGIDRILVYRVVPGAGRLVAHEPPAVSVKPGAGPRHFAFAPDGRCACVINELDSTVIVFIWDAEAGRLAPIETVRTAPEGAPADNTGSHVEYHPSGRFLYASNRGHDSIAVFGADRATGRLTPRGHDSTRGRTPRHFAVDPSGRFLMAANQHSDRVVVFRVDPVNGRLSPTGYEAAVPSPVCVRILS